MSGKRKHSTSGKARRGSRPKQLFWWIGLGVVLVAALTFFLFRPGISAPVEISADQAHQKYEAGVFFLDVRTQQEWDEGHLAHSTLIPLDELPDRLAELPGDAEIVVICRSGRRSQEGAALLGEAGFRHVASVHGGIQAWIDAGYPLE